MNAGNRVLWIAIGVVLTGAGVVGLLASLGRLRRVDNGTFLLGPVAAQRWHSWGGAAPALAIAAGLLVAVLGFLLLRAQLRGPGGAPMPDLVLPGEPPGDPILGSPDAIAPMGLAPTGLALGAPDPDGPDNIHSGPYVVGPGAGPVPGRTQVASRALHHALVHDLQGGDRVRRAAVRLSGEPEHPELLVRLDVAADTDIARLHSHVDGALDRFAVTTGIRPHLHDVVVRMADQAPARVH
jgi:hypothetical protein